MGPWLILTTSAFRICQSSKVEIAVVLSNLLGSGTAIGLCSWYHRRMLERRRQNKRYQSVPGEDPDIELIGAQQPDPVTASENDMSNTQADEPVEEDNETRV